MGSYAQGHGHLGVGTVGTERPTGAAFLQSVSAWIKRAARHLRSSRAAVPGRSRAGHRKPRGESAHPHWGRRLSYPLHIPKPQSPYRAQRGGPVSVVAWRDGVIAADRQGTCSDMRLLSVKMRRLPSGVVVAWTGTQSQGLILADWYEAGADPAAWPKFQEDKDDWTRLIVASKAGVYCYERHPRREEQIDPFLAWGSGRDFAMGAMAQGASAARAVEVASQYSVGCGMGVDVMELA